MRRFFTLTMAAVALLGLLYSGSAQAAPEPHLTMEILGTPDIVAPKGALTRAVVLFSDADGWNGREQTLAATLAAQGAVVIGLDLPEITRRMQASDRRCLILIGEIEAITHQIESHLNAPSYVFPSLVGIGAGGAMAMAIAAQTEAATIERVLVVDPDAVVPTRKTLCSDGPMRPRGTGMRYDLPQGAEPFTITIALTGQGSPQGEAHALRQQERRRRVVVRQTPDQDPAQVLLGLLAEPAADSTDALAGLPLVDLPALGDSTTYQQTVAIFYSGDGGWRDLDKDLAALLQRHGLAVVGVDVLRYFWKPQTPEQTAQDLDRIITSLHHDRGVRRVVLIGFSFGADILPAAYNRLSAEARAMVVQMSLLGVSKAADFEVTVSGWLSQKLPDALPIAPELAKINPRLIQCFYGEDDNSAICNGLEGSGAEVIRTSGGHHFDGDYEGLAKRVLHSLEKRH
jgi:type IV secretory pathway VirJ component